MDFASLFPTLDQVKEAGLSKLDFWHKTLPAPGYTGDKMPIDEARVEGGEGYPVFDCPQTQWG